MEQELEYRGYKIYYDPKPIPVPGIAWSFVHKAYDGEGDPRHGYAADAEACKREIDELIEEHGE